MLDLEFCRNRSIALNCKINVPKVSKFLQQHVHDVKQQVGVPLLLRYVSHYCLKSRSFCITVDVEAKTKECNLSNYGIA